MLVIDAQRRIRLMNASAAAMLERQDLVFGDEGTLACRDAESDRRVGLAVRAMAHRSPHRAGADAPERRAVWLRRSDGLTAAAALHAMHGERTARRLALRVLVTIFEPHARPSPDPRLLAEAYRLTTAEARLAALVAEGHRTAHCARVLGVKTSTLRSQLGSIYRKTGANGKADLVRLVLSLCAI